MKNKQQDRSSGRLESNLAMDSGEWPIVYDFLSSMMTEVIIVLDFDRKIIQYISNNDIFLSCYMQNAPVTLDYGYFNKVIHPKDISFWEDIHNTILDSLNNDLLPIDLVNYFSFMLRVKSPLFSTGKSNYFMTYIKLKPQWLNDQLRYGICILSASVIRKQDNQLSVHYKNMDYADYSFKTKKWKHYRYSPLSKKQKEVLMWAQQGLSLKETAAKMNVANKTIENVRRTLFEKFGVNTIEQAIQYASNRRLIYHFPSDQSESDLGVIE